MPQDRENPFPFPTAEEVEAAPGDPAMKAARNVVTRHIPGIPRRGFLLGGNDTSPILQGVRDLTAAALALCDEIDPEPDAPVPHLSREIQDRLAELRAILEHHGCPTAEEQAADMAQRVAAREAAE